MRLQALALAGSIILCSLPALAQKSEPAELKCFNDTRVLDKEPRRGGINFSECIWVKAGCKADQVRCVCGAPDAKGQRTRGECAPKP